jgi:hypothetical protein
MGLTIQNCASTFDGNLPPGLSGFPNPSVGQSPANGAYGGLLYHLLPFLEQQNLYNQSTDGNVGYDVLFRGGVCTTTTVKTYICPSDPTAPATDGGWAVGSYC